MKKGFLLVLMLTLILSGCSSPNADETPVAIKVPESTKNTAVETETESNTESSTEQTNTEETDYTSVINLDTTLLDQAAYIDANIANVTPELANQMIEEWIIALDAHTSDKDQYFYGEDAPTFIEMLYAVYDQMYALGKVATFMGDEKFEMIKYVDDPDFAAALKTMFDEGYSIQNAEGMYYPAPDYVYIKSHYSNFLSEQLRTYLDILVTEITDPTFAEESLLVSVEELFSRTAKYEKFFYEATDLPEAMRVNLSSLLNMCYFKLLVPANNAMLDADGKVTDALKATYTAASTHTETPILASLTAEMLTFFSLKGDVLNVYEDEEVYQHANDYFENVIVEALALN